MKYKEFSLSLVSTPQKLKEFNEVYKRIREDSNFRNYVMSSFKNNMSLNEYDYAALWHAEYLDGLERRVEQNKTDWQSKQKVME